MRGRCGAPAPGAGTGHRGLGLAPGRRRRARYPAHAGLPARAAAGRVPRAILGQEGGHRRQRAGRHLRREGLPRGLLPQPAGRDPAGYRQLSFAWHRQAGRGRRSAAGRRRRGPRRGRRRRGQGRRPGRIRQQPQRGRAQRPDRPAGRSRRRDRAHHPGPVPPPQEQSAVRGRGRRGQDRHRRRPGQAHRGRLGAGRAGRRDHLLAGPGRAGGRHQVPRRLREAPQGRADRAEEDAQRGAVHR